MKKHITVSQLATTNVGKESLYIGRAINTDQGAALVLENGVLYMEGIATWNEKQIGRVLLVNGVLAKKRSLKGTLKFSLKKAKQVPAK